MRIAICDDDDAMRSAEKNLCRLRTRGNKKEIVYAEFSSGQEILAYEEQIDILILDIEMPNMTGIEIKNALEAKNKEIIIFFVTSHDELVLEAFGINVIGFVKKPIEENNFNRLLDKALERVKEPVVFKIDDLTFIDSREIIYVKAERVYSILVDTKNNEFFLRQSLNEIQKTLENETFIRVHKSFLVNMKYIEKIKEKIIMVGKKEVAVSRRLKQEVVSAYDEYCRKMAR